MSGAKPDHRLVVFLVGLTQLIITTDFSIVAVALPSVGAQLHIPPASLSWVISAAALSGGGFLIVAGRAADIFGQRACMLVGLSLFAGGSLGAAFAPDFGVLIAARIVQGLGGAILTPANFSLINTLVPEGAPRRRAMGVFGLMQGLSLVIGLLIGGALTTRFGWRAVFLLNPPIALLAIAITWRAVPARLARAAAKTPIDWLGAALIVAGMTLVLLGVSAMGREGVSAPRPLGLLIAGIVGFILFFVVERRAVAPLAPLSMFGRRNFTSAAIILLVHLAGIGGVFVLLSLYMQTGLKMSALRSGLGMMPYAAAVMLAGTGRPLADGAVVAPRDRPGDAGALRPRPRPARRAQRAAELLDRGRVGRRRHRVRRDDGLHGPDGRRHLRHPTRPAGSGVGGAVHRPADRHSARRVHRPVGAGVCRGQRPGRLRRRLLRRWPPWSWVRWSSPSPRCVGPRSRSSANLSHP